MISDKRDCENKIEEHLAEKLKVKSSILDKLSQTNQKICGGGGH
jgi:hypothetical protein